MISGKNYKNFQKIYNDQKLSHHPFKRMFIYLNWCFKNIDFNDQNVLTLVEEMEFSLITPSIKGQKR